MKNDLFFIVEDNRSIAFFLSDMLTSQCEDIEPLIFGDAQSAIKTLQEKHAAGHTILGVIADLKLAHDDASESDGFSGWDVIVKTVAISRTIPVAVSSSNLKTSCNSQRFRALVPDLMFFDKHDYEYEEHICDWLTQICDRREQLSQPLLQINGARDSFDDIVRAYADSDIPILIYGESGTGKELVARRIHNESSRRNSPFRTVNCGALLESTAVADLFGCESGAFTGADYTKLGIVLEASGYKGLARHKGPFENYLKKSGNKLIPDSTDQDCLGLQNPLANAGTLFLDEVDSLPKGVMAALLRVLSSHDVRPLGSAGPSIRAYCRIISATNRSDLLDTHEAPQNADIFRADLYFRLSGVVINMPTLTGFDVIHSFVTGNYFWHKTGLNKPKFSHDAIQMIADLYDKTNTDMTAAIYQRGNYRSLSHLVQRSALIAKSERVQTVEICHIRRAIEHGSLVAPQTPARRNEQAALASPTTQKNVSNTSCATTAPAIEAALSLVPSPDIHPYLAQFNDKIQRLESRPNYTPVETWDGLRKLTIQNPILAAAGVIHVYLGLKEKYPSIRKITENMTFGRKHGTWINNSGKGAGQLNVSHFLQASSIYYDLPEAGLREYDSISDLLKHLKQVLV